ncbi:MAG TPA: hypothetical protein PLD86_05650 [Vicinamibacteria bacterium]|nr:hypothetical protein [Vicinamibacteria bacterium]
MNGIRILAGLLASSSLLACAPGGKSEPGPPPSPMPVTLAQDANSVPVALAGVLFEEVVKDGINSPEEIEALRKERGFNPARFFVGERVDLDGDGKRELLVQSSRNEPLCPTPNCPAWVYRVEGESYVRLLSDVAGYIDGVTVLATRTKGLLDIRIQQHSSAAERDVVVYRFDGQAYRPSDCTTDTYDVTDRGVEKVKTVARPCP